MWSHGEGSGKPLQDSCFENHVSTMTPGDEPPSSVGVQYATEEERRNSSNKKVGTGIKKKRHSVVDMSGGKGQVQC